VSVRALAAAFGERLGKTPILLGAEETTCWLVNTREAARAVRLSGRPARAQ